MQGEFSSWQEAWADMPAALVSSETKLPTLLADKKPGPCSDDVIDDLLLNSG